MKRCPTCHCCYEESQAVCAKPEHLPLVAESPRSALIGDRYRLDRMIARGGMGVVYAATNIQCAEQVAIKLLHPAFAATPAAMERFRCEADAAARIQHPGIAKTLGYERLPDGTAYIVMELVEGLTLRQRLDAQGRIELREALSIAKQVGRAIEAAHRVGVVHRDLTPSNIILTRWGCKVVDFGIAQLVEFAHSREQIARRSQFGTLRYMSPEQRLHGEVDARSDVYSLGLILREMLTESSQSPAMTELLAKALQADPNLRFTSAAHLVEQIERIERDSEVLRSVRCTPASLAYARRVLDDVTVEIRDDDQFEQTAQIDAVIPKKRLSRRLEFSVAAMLLMGAGALWLSIDSLMFTMQSDGARTAEHLPLAGAVNDDFLAESPAAHASILDSVADLDPESSARAALTSALENWLASTNARNFEAQLSFYPAKMERFYLWRNVSRSAVLAEKRRVFGQADLIDMKAAAPEIHLEPGGQGARMRFNKRYLIQGKHVYRKGEVLQELRWAKTGTEWKIVSERDLRVIS